MALVTLFLKGSERQKKACVVDIAQSSYRPEMLGKYTMLRPSSRARWLNAAKAISCSRSKINLETQDASPSLW